MHLFWILLLVTALALLLAATVNRERRAPRLLPVQRYPLEIIRERYARGEIGQAEYEHMRKDLCGS